MTGRNVKRPACVDRDGSVGDVEVVSVRLPGAQPCMSPPAGPGRNALHTKRSLPVFDDQENQNPLATAGAPVCSSPEVKDFGSQPAPKRQKKHSTCHEEQQLDVSLSPRTAPSPDSSDTPQVVSSQAQQQMHTGMPLNADRHNPILADMTAAHEPATSATAAVSQSVTPITQLIWDPSAAAAQQAAGPVQPAAPGQEALKGCPQYQEVRSTSQGHAAAGSPDDLAITCQQSEQTAQELDAQAAAGGVPPARKLCTKCRQVQSADQFHRHKTNFDKRQSYCKQCKRKRGKDVKVPTVQEKKCSRCCEVRPASSFSRDKHSRNGLHSACKDCKKAAGPVAEQPTVPDKPCSKCHVLKPASSFCFEKRNRDGLQSRCKDCKQAALPVVEQPTVPDKTCSKCYVLKSASSFDGNKRSHDGLYSACKDCKQAARPVVEQPTVSDKTCSKCHVLKPASSFTRSKRSHDGLESRCKDCKKKPRPVNLKENSVPPVALPTA